MVGGLAALLVAVTSGAWATSAAPMSSSLASEVTASTIYTGIAQVEATAQTASATPVILFYGATGALLESVSGAAVQATAGRWSAIQPVVAIAPPGTTSAKLAFSGPARSAVAVKDESLTSAPAQLASDVEGPLHTAGNQIVQANGSPLILRGFDFYGLVDSATPALSQQVFIAAKEWGANLIRVSLVENYLVSGMCGYSSSYASDISQVVNWITSLGMVALLDLHLSAPVLCLTPGEQEMADDPGSLEFWNELASQYKANQLVAFDLFNEPHGISNQVWLNGGQATDFVTYQAVGMQELYDTVRATGAQNLTFISGNNWGNTLPGTLVSGSNIVYSVHAYTCPNSLPPDCTDATPYDPSTLLDPWAAPSSEIPVFVGEFGWPSPSNGAYMRNVIAFAQAHGWGWDAYAWTDPPSSYALIAQDPTSGPYEPSPTGMPALDALAGGDSG